MDKTAEFILSPQCVLYLELSSTVHQGVARRRWEWARGHMTATAVGLIRNLEHYTVHQESLATCGIGKKYFENH